MADWFTDADVEAAGVALHQALAEWEGGAGDDLRRLQARAVLASLGPRIAQERAVAWGEGFKQGGPMHDSDYDDPDKHTRNPYREADGSA